MPQVKATARGFEPLRAEPNGFRVHLLNRSDTLSLPLHLEKRDELIYDRMRHTVAVWMSVCCYIYVWMLKFSEGPTLSIQSSASIAQW